MKKKFNFKIFIIIFFTILVFIYLVVFNIKKNTKVEIQADVTSIGTNYVIATDSEDNEYLLNTSEQYNIGDKINVVLKNVKKGNPYTGEIVKIDTVSRNVSFSIKDEIPNDQNIKNESKEENITKEEPIVKESNKNNTEENVNDIIQVSSEEELITYLNDFSREIDNSDTLKKNIKDKFVMIVDFLFYDGKIGNKTFAELSNSTKLKVLELALTIDQKIENKFPGYKESISTNGNRIYTNLKTRALELYLDITTSVCEINSELCDDAKIGLGELKSSFSLTWDFLKGIAGSGLTKLKSWYEVWKEV